MTRTCGGVPALSVSAARCSTPNRCCSSTTTRPRSKNWTCSSSNACVPITMPDSPVASRDSGSVRWALVIEPVRQLDARAAHHPAVGQLAQHGGDGAVVLLGEHLGRREEGGLAAGVDHPQHRPERHEGLAGADLALEQTVHRVRLGQVVLDLGPDVALALGQLERQPCVERRQQVTLAAVARPGAHGAQRPTPAAEHQLGDQGLLEPVAVLGAADLAPGSGAWIQSSACRASSRSSVWRELVGQQLGQLVDDGAGEADRALQVPRLDALGQRVDAGRTAPIDSSESCAVSSPGRPNSTICGWVELPLAAEGVGLAQEDPAPADRHAAGVPFGHPLVLGEERHPQRVALRADRDVDAVGRPAGSGGPGSC